MKIDISKIDEGRFVIREENNVEYIDQLSESIKVDGQWNPIILRQKEGGRFEVIAGHYRLKAAKKAGMTEIEATVRDLPDEDADILSLKTNLLRMEMTAREQGRVLSKIMESYGWSQTEVAKRLNVGRNWVGTRLRVALELHDEVVKALDTGKVNFNVAAVIAGVPLQGQPAFLKIIIEKKLTDHTDVWILRKKFLNNAIYTIGYQGHTTTSFINLLKENEIELVVDIRFSSESQFKPEFNGSILQRELERNKIQYIHRRDFGLPYLIQNPYKDGALGYECIKQWYKWHIDTETDFDMFIDEIKSSGKTVLLCMEQTAKAKGDQKYACHRDIFADLIISHKSSDPLMKYKKRVDL